MTRVRIGDVDCSAASVHALGHLDTARAASESARRQLARHRREAVRALALDGGSLRAIARLIGVSYQRVGQIAAELRDAGQLPRDVLVVDSADQAAPSEPPPTDEETPHG